MELEPSAYDVYFLAVIEVGFDVELGSLVDENDKKDYEERRAVFHIYGFESVKDKGKRVMRTCRKGLRIKDKGLLFMGEERGYRMNYKWPIKDHTCKL
jgi:hypothetical protein